MSIVCSASQLSPIFPNKLSLASARGCNLDACASLPRALTLSKRLSNRLRAGRCFLMAGAALHGRWCGRCFAANAMANASGLWAWRVLALAWRMLALAWQVPWQALCSKRHGKRQWFVGMACAGACMAGGVAGALWQTPWQTPAVWPGDRCLLLLWQVPKHLPKRVHTPARKRLICPSVCPSARESVVS